MFISRILFFRLHESAKYLVHAGRPSEALVALQRISRVNGDAVTWHLSDVADEGVLSPIGGPVAVDYGTPSPGSVRSFGRGSVERWGREVRGGGGAREEEEGLGEDEDEDEGAPGYGRGMRRRNDGARVQDGTLVDWLPGALAASVEDYRDRLRGLFEPKWALTTKLVWTIWAFASAGYTVRFSPAPLRVRAKADVTGAMRRGNPDLQRLSPQVLGRQSGTGSWERRKGAEFERLSVPRFTRLASAHSSPRSADVLYTGPFSQLPSLTAISPT